MTIEWTKTTTGECKEFEDIPEGATVDAIDGREVAGQCEGCGVYLFADEPYESDGEGVRLCPACAAACLEDYQRENRDDPRYVTHDMAMDAGDMSLEGSEY